MPKVYNLIVVAGLSIVFLGACQRVESTQVKPDLPIESPLQNNCQPIGGFAAHVPICDNGDDHD